MTWARSIGITGSSGPRSTTAAGSSHGSRARPVSNCRWLTLRSSTSLLPFPIRKRERSGRWCICDDPAPHSRSSGSSGERGMPTGILRCAAHNPRTNTRLDEQVADEAARRVGVLSILTAATLVGKAVLQLWLQPEMAPAFGSPGFRLAALYLVLASAGLAALQRSGAVCSQMLLDLGLGLEVTGAFSLGVMENA